MKPWTDFYPYILIYLPGCPYPVVDQALLLASMEYFDKSLAWKEWLDPVQTLAGVNEYDFEITPSQQEIVQLCAATTDGDDLPLALPDELPSDWQTGYGKPGIFTRDRRSFWLTETPVAAGQFIKTEVTLKPSLTATGIPDELFAHHAQAIAFGAAGQVMTIAGEPFTNAGLSLYFRGQFYQGIQDAGLAMVRSHSRFQLRTKKSPI
ncbi:MAG: hypothetical protein JWR74_1191 [Polaromonas sp.]|nr:hypothetical protein [Polaromonas sp.]